MSATFQTVSDLEGSYSGKFYIERFHHDFRLDEHEVLHVLLVSNETSASVLNAIRHVLDQRDLKKMILL